MDRAIEELRKLRVQLHNDSTQFCVRVELLEERLESITIALKAMRRSTAQVNGLVSDRKRHEELWSHIEEIKQKHTAMIHRSLEYHVRNKRPGRVRVAMIPHFKDLGLPLPLTHGFVNVLISETRVKKSLAFLDPINLAEELLPDSLKDSRGRLYTNLAAFAHCYLKPKAQNQGGGWAWPTTTCHIDANEDVTEEYFNWRRSGSARTNPIPHPAGVPGTLVYTAPEFCLWPAALLGGPNGSNISGINNPAVDYYNFERTGSTRIHPGWETYARVEYPLYAYLAKQTAGYKRLAAMIAGGTNVQLLCHDAPKVLTSANRLPTPPFDKVLPGICGESGAKSLEIDRTAVIELRRLDLEYMSHGYSLAIALLDGAAWLNG